MKIKNYYTSLTINKLIKYFHIFLHLAQALLLPGIIPVLKKQFFIFLLKLKVMKTRFILIAVIPLFLVLTHATVPAEAQRRNSRNEVVKQKNEQKKDSREAKAKSTFKDDESKVKTRQNTSGVRRTATRENRSNSAVKSAKPAVNRKNGSATRERKVYQEKQQYRNQQPASVQRRKPETNRSSLRNAPAGNRRESFRQNDSQRYNSPQRAAVSPRARKEYNSKLYRVDTRDSRYVPAKNFKGNKNHWNAGYAKHHVHYKNHNENFYRNYNYRKHLHWDHNWETYRWNVNSWREYYSGYHPYSYRFHKHYYFHPVYGHVVRKFGAKPDYFVHNRVRYYNYNGHFFRHFPGVGYVLADMPFGLVFHKLPRYAERVYINGYLYFRVGNLFFEKNPHGFALIHYPERYYALETDFYNGGYYREIDFYIYR